MKKTITIGTKMNQKKNLFLIFICFSLPLFISIIAISKGFNHSFQFISPIFLGIILLIVVFIFMIPFFGTNQYLEISEYYVTYYHNENLVDQISALWRLLRKKESSPDVKIIIKDIQFLKLDFRQTQMMGLKGAALVLKFQMKDHTVIEISPDYLVSSDGIYLEAIAYLESLGVSVLDEYHLKPGLVSNAKYFQEYLSKENIHHG